jgi:hypothetical protein
LLAVKEQYLKDKKQELSDLRARLKMEHNLEIESIKRDFAREKELELRATQKKLDDQRQLEVDREKVCCVLSSSMWRAAWPALL